MSLVLAQKQFDRTTPLNIIVEATRFHTQKNSLQILLLSNDVQVSKAKYHAICQHRHLERVIRKDDHRNDHRDDLNEIRIDRIKVINKQALSALPGFSRKLFERPIKCNKINITTLLFNKETLLFLLFNNKYGTSSFSTK